MKVGEDGEAKDKDVLPRKCAQQAAISSLYAGEKFTQKNYGLFYKAFPHVWKEMTGSKTAEYIEADLFPLLVRKC